MSAQFSRLVLVLGVIIIAALIVLTRKAWATAVGHGGPTVWRIAKMTMAEARRRRVLQVVVLLVVVVIASLTMFTYLSPAEQARMVKDSGLIAVAGAGMLLSIFMAALFIPHEIESRTIYPILAKPVRRYEFVLGKYVGAMIILGVICAIVTLVLVGVLLLQDRLVPDQPDSRFDPTIGPVIFAAVTSYFSLGVFTALVMLISSVASTTMTIISSILLWLVGSMQSSLYDLSTKVTGVSHVLALAFYRAVPPLQNLDFRTNVSNGVPIDLNVAIQAAGSGLLYAIVALVFASIFFENRQV